MLLPAAALAASLLTSAVLQAPIALPADVLAAGTITVNEKKFAAPAESALFVTARAKDAIAAIRINSPAFVDGKISYTLKLQDALNGAEAGQVIHLIDHSSISSNSACIGTIAAPIGAQQQVLMSQATQFQHEYGADFRFRAQLNYNCGLRVSAVESEDAQYCYSITIWFIVLQIKYITDTTSSSSTHSTVFVLCRLLLRLILQSQAVLIWMVMLILEDLMILLVEDS
jgi:hypothetical protein